MEGTAYKRTARGELSFAGERLVRGRHKIHPYPAMLHPLLVECLLEKYARDDDVVFDPFCGSGVTLLQSSVRGHASYGFDINPLALLIARAKTQTYDTGELREEFAALKTAMPRGTQGDVPDIRHKDYWYARDVVRDLGRIRYVIKNSDCVYKDFFVSCFAFVCRNQSLTRNGEFKRYRIEAGKIHTRANEVFDKFFEHTGKIIDEFEASDTPRGASEVRLANSEDSIDEGIEYDLVITSPPYGDSGTTVAYGQYSSFGAEWTDDLNAFGGVRYKVDNECLGKAGARNGEMRGHKVLLEVIRRIGAADRKRADDVLNFFNGYYSAIKNVSRNLRRGGRMCFVVGNRNVKGCQIPMDQITASFLEERGLSFENIFVREILNKVMPSKNSPSNKTGITARTMANEYIVVFGKKCFVGKGESGRARWR